MNLFEKLGFFVLFCIGSILPLSVAFVSLHHGFYVVSVLCFYMAYTQLIGFSKFVDAATQFREIRKELADIKATVAEKGTIADKVEVEKVEKKVAEKVRPMAKSNRLPKYLQGAFKSSEDELFSLN